MNWGFAVICGVLIVGGAAAAIDYIKGHFGNEPRLNKPRVQANSNAVVACPRCSRRVGVSQCLCPNCGGSIKRRVEMGVYLGSDLKMTPRPYRRVDFECQRCLVKPSDTDVRCPSCQASLGSLSDRFELRAKS